ncbi:MAG TPA: benzoate-CoA ligase family protein [Alphaproteobacteria bacterium]|jgi:benzoate-CoA ligase family protein
MAIAATKGAVRPGLKGNVVDYLFEHALRPENANRPFMLIDDGRVKVTFRELYERACQTGYYLRAIGLKPGDRMMMSVMDGRDFGALFLGALKIGVIPLPLNTYLRPRDYLYYLNDSEAKAAFVDASLAKTIDEVRPQTKHARFFGMLGGAAKGYEAFEPGVDAQPKSLDTLPRKPDEMAFWLYSSGSTGDPKGVVHTHDHLYWACELGGIGALGINRDDVISCPPKMFFAFGLGGQIYFSLRAAAATLVSASPITPKRVWEQWIAHEPTMCMAVPTLFAGMLQVAEKEIGQEKARKACRRMRFVLSAGEILPPALMHRWKDYTGVECLDGVGTTEMTHLFIMNRPGHPVPGSCGRIVDGYRHEILDDDGRPVKRGEIGNLHVYGPSAAAMYWNKPEKTKAVMGRGGVLTGDKVREDEHGNLFMVGRSDDMLRVGAIWVSPAEVEGALVSHSAVAEAAVVGHPDEEQLIKPKAYVVLRDSGAHPDKAKLEAELKEHVRKQLPGVKVPRWIDFPAELPKTATGKIQRFRLRG